LRIGYSRVAGNPGRRRARTYGRWHFAARTAGSGVREEVGSARTGCASAGAGPRTHQRAGRKDF
jgi:hypothetical protein